MLSYLVSCSLINLMQYTFLKTILVYYCNPYSPILISLTVPSYLFKCTPHLQISLKEMTNHLNYNFGLHNNKNYVFFYGNLLALLSIVPFGLIIAFRSNSKTSYFTYYESNAIVTKCKKELIETLIIQIVTN